MNGDEKEGSELKSVTCTSRGIFWILDLGATCFFGVVLLVVEQGRLALLVQRWRKESVWKREWNRLVDLK